MLLEGALVEEFFESIGVCRVISRRILSIIVVVGSSPGLVAA